MFKVVWAEYMNTEVMFLNKVWDHIFKISCWTYGILKKNFFCLDFLNVYMVCGASISVGGFYLVVTFVYWDLGGVSFFLVHLERWKTYAVYPLNLWRGILLITHFHQKWLTMWFHECIYTHTNLYWIGPNIPSTDYWKVLVISLDSTCIKKSLSKWLLVSLEYHS